MNREARVEDRRKLKRRYLMFYSRVYDRKSGRLIGHLSDLTVEGLMIIGEEQTEIHRRYVLSMDLPEDIFGKPHMTFEADARWCQRDVDPAFYNSGWHLEKIAPEDVEIIERIIEAYGFRDG